VSPARQSNGSLRKRKVARPGEIRPPLASKRRASPSTQAAKKSRDLAPQAFLETIARGRKFVFFPKKQIIFSQGDPADAVFYLQSGKVRLTVVSKTGKEATIGIFGEHDFFGEGLLAGQPFPHGNGNRHDRLRNSANR
jgi:CRP-like cAMP-binding protein